MNPTLVLPRWSKSTKQVSKVFLYPPVDYLISRRDDGAAGRGLG